MKYDFTKVAKRKNFYKRTRKATPQRFCFFDIETFVERTGDKILMPFRLCCTRLVTISPDGKLSHSWKRTHSTIDEFYEYVLQKISDEKSIKFVAHNISFDLSRTKLIEFLISKGFKMANYYSQNTTTVIALKKKKLTITFLDSMNFFSSTLAEISKFTDTKKHEVNFQNCTKRELEKHCRQDVDIIAEVFARYKKFLYEFAGTNMSYTRAADIASIFRGTQEARKVHYPKFDSDVDIELRAFYGGRVECFRIGKYDTQKYYKVDFNSLYPSVMRDGLFSTRLIGDYEDYDFNEEKEIADNYNVLVECDLDINYDYCPCRDIRGLFFPVGKFKTVLAGVEAEHALLHGHTSHVHRLRHYQRSNIFFNLVTELYEKRRQAKKQGDTANSYMLKLMMNSLYGKFTQRTGNLKKIGHNKSIQYGSLHHWNDEQNEAEILRVINYDIYRNLKNLISANTSPIIGAEITALARMKLWSAIITAERKNVYYCDTDSLIVNEDGYNNLSNLLDDEKLGWLKLEGVSNEIEITGPKNYKFGDEKVLKGIPKSAKIIGEDLYQYESFRTLHSSFFSDSKNEIGAEVKTRKVDPTLWKGVECTTGVVSPWRLGVNRT